MGLVVAAAACVGSQRAEAAPTITNLVDSGTLISTTSNPPSNSVSNVINPYGSLTPYSLTPITSGLDTIGWKVTFYPSSGFSTGSVNNLAGGKSNSFQGLLSFDIEFDTTVHLTTNIFESGIYSAAGNGRAAVNSPDLASGAVVTPMDPVVAAPDALGITHVFLTTALVAPTPIGPGHNFPANSSGSWHLYDQITGFSMAYKKYHVVIDNDLLAESAPSQLPGFATVAKKNFSISFTFDGSSGGAVIPEPASLSLLAFGTLALLARRRR